MKHSKRVLVLILSVMMVFTALPLPAFAGEADEPEARPDGAVTLAEEVSGPEQAQAPVVEEPPAPVEEAAPAVTEAEVSAQETVVQEPGEGARAGGSNAAAPAKTNAKKDKVAAAKAADHVLTVELPTAGQSISSHQYPEAEDSNSDGHLWRFPWVESEGELAKELAYAAGDHTTTYSGAKGNFEPGKTYYCVLMVEFPEGETADVSRVAFTETNDIKQIGDPILVADDNRVVIAFSATIPYITVTVEFGTGHESVAAAAAAASEDVEMTVSGSTLTYKAQKGSDRWYDVTHPIRGVLYDVPHQDNGERMYEGFVNYNLKPLSDYTDITTWQADLDDVMDSVPQNENLTVYIQWAKPASGTISIEPLVCGTEVSMNSASDTQMSSSDPAPQVTVLDGDLSVPEQGMKYWVETDEDGYPLAPYLGTVQGGETYTAMISLQAAFGYFIDADKITVEGGTPREVPMGGGHILLIDVEAVHDWDTEAVEIDWDVDNNCTATVYCRADESHVLTETVKGDPKVTKEPTATEWGETTYTANFKNKILREAVGADNTLTLEDIEPITYQVVEGNGQTWEKGSGVSCDFRFKRSYKDSETYGKFVGIQVDGEDVDAGEYLTEEGSVIIKIQPAYLETLANGKHTLTARFEDGSADATFTIREGGAKTGDDANLGLWSLLLALSLLAMTGTATALRRREDR